MLKGAANRQTGTLAAVGGIALLLIAALGIVVQLKDALNVIWEVDPARGTGWWAYLRAYLISFIGVLTLGFLLAVSLVINAALAAAISRLGALGTAVWQSVNSAISLLVLGTFFGLLFKYLPDIDVQWKDVLPSAITTAVLFDLGKEAISWYIGRLGIQSTYGAASSIVVLLIWVYYSAQILLFGAELTRAYAESRTSAG
jgi:membrane protein